jgi:hypothetical protein
MLVQHFGGHCYIKCYDKDGIAVSTSPILVKDEGDSIIAIVDDFFDQYFPDPERIREIVAGDIIEPATVHEHVGEKHYCYVRGNYRIDGIRLNVFDQCPYAKHPVIKKAEEDSINISCQYSEDEEYTKYFKKQDDIIIK